MSSSSNYLALWAVDKGRLLKVPKRENFLLAFFAQTKPIWVCDLENKKIKKIFERLTP